MNNTQVAILTAIHLLSGSQPAPSVNTVYKYLIQTGREVSYEWVSKNINSLIKLGLLRKQLGIKIVRCNLSIDGRIELFLLEKTLRCQRIDR